MKKYLINWLKKSVYLFVFTGVISVHAGSYEDFFAAIKQDNAGVVQQLLARGFDPNTTDPKGQHGLYLALQEPSLKVAQVLTDWPKTDVNKLNAQGESPLMIAALKGELDMAASLIKKDADVNKTGWTPLHYAASKGHLAIMSLLLDNNAYIDAESPNGTTPLMMAAMYGTAPAVKLLLEAGADPMLKNQQDLTAIEFAQRASRTESAQLLATTIRSRNATGKW
ncbi:ankyrin repeat domain-containing protein [Polaromonas sp. SM01]|uniref:ankyrin repeat domain-containing protein n=1 Tax=Polaromonas sp. SM01 TaxID=3085630 RepID=UPI002981770F|nr:ankyrin repeat domain-containing protein [Polaromonas sp. SM01]MDW5444385.1 ankyrin repeat domain-containing protein [Polaromonas sp. SM01]